MAKGLESNFFGEIKQLQDSNNALARENANAANAFTWRSQLESERFNAEEAQKNRLFQLDMSNSQHQREVLDLKKAGLNPILSANNGAGVSSGSAGSVGMSSGTKADIDTQLASLWTQYKMNKINNAQNLKINKMNNKVAKEISQINSAASMYSANAGLQGALASASASRFAAAVQAEIAANRLQYDKDHPSNMYEAIGEILSRLGDGGLGLTNSYTDPGSEPKTKDKGNQKTGQGRN